jgi:hypothetical protein
MKSVVISCALLAVVSLSASARAEDKDEGAAVSPVATVTAAKPAPEPYVLPFQLRGVRPVTALRLDTTVAPFTDPKTHLGQTETVSFFSASGRVSDSVALSARFGVVRNDHPNPASSIAANGVTNVALGAMYGTKVARYLNLSASTGVVLPVGSGGGNSPDLDRAAAMKAGALARAGMDNGMFGVNELHIPLGLDAAYVRRGFTAQVEISLYTSVRARGEQRSPDKSKANATSGLFVGYFIVPRRFSVGAELRYQRFLSTPDAVAKDPSQRDNLTAGGGVRGHFQLASNVDFRPGLSYGAGLAGVAADRHYQMVGIDLPVVF